MKLNSFILPLIVLLSLISFSFTGFTMDEDTLRNERRTRAIHVAPYLINSEIHETDTHTYSRMTYGQVTDKTILVELNNKNLLIKTRMILFWPPQSITYWVIFTKKEKPHKSIMDITFIETTKKRSLF